MTVKININSCLLLCIVVILDNPKSTAIWNCTHYRDSDELHRTGYDTLVINQLPQF